MTDRKVLITGAAGFAGSALSGSLLELGFQVTGLDVVAPNHASLLREQFSHENFRYLWKSVQDIQPSDVEGAFSSGPPCGAAGHADGLRVAPLHRYAERGR